MDQESLFEEKIEGLIFVAQEQALRTNWIRKNIDGQEVLEKYRMYQERDVSITHLIAECKKLLQKEYKQRQDNIARTVHQELCQKLAQLARLSGIITNLQVQLRMTGSKYCGILLSKQTMLFNTEDMTQLCCTKRKENVTLLILLYLETKGLT